MMIEKAKDQFEKILRAVGIDTEDCWYNNGQLRSSCPIHDGDNESAFCYYTSNHRWRCYTHGCHEQGNSLYDLVKAFLQKSGTTVSNDEVTKFIQEAIDDKKEYTPIVKTDAIEQRL
jgi:hypothetical protein